MADRNPPRVGSNDGTPKVEFQGREGADAASLQRVLSSPRFTKSPGLAKLLQYLFQSKATNLAASDIARKLFRNETHQSARVGIAISRLRSELHDFYSNEGRADGVRISIPKGSYRLIFGSPTTSPDDKPAPTGGTCASTEDLAERRYGDLVEKKFAAGLTDAEQLEMDTLFAALGRADDAFYAPILANLRKSAQKAS